jgi:hypothetical protein
MVNTLREIDVTKPCRCRVRHVIELLRAIGTIRAC